MRSLLLFAAIFLFACSPEETGQAEADPRPVLPIGFIYAGDTPGGVPSLQAAQIAVREQEAAGGVSLDGTLMRVELWVEETTADPESSARALARLLQRGTPAAIIGPSTSPPAMPVVELAERRGVPAITPYAGNDDITAGKRFVFRASYPNSAVAGAVARILKRQFKAQRVGVLYDRSIALDRNFLANLERELERRDIEIVPESFLAQEENYRPHFRRLQAAGVDVLLFSSPIGGIAEIQNQQMIELGLEIPRLGLDYWNPNVLRDHPEMAGVHYIYPWHPDLAEFEPTRGPTFLEKFRRLSGTEPMATAALTYDSFNLLFEALAAADGTSSEDVRNALEEVRGFIGLTGGISFFRGRHDPAKPFPVLYFDGERSRVVDVLPAER